ncbi:uncharacterized protein LOC130974544 [Arachis stenosperma]|uniref:uncharacterized protein LOC130974544 n=1 Tax=Arachis stenosperma TaxID=217475 RepID=UPI0025AC69E8|nr:uncharacterized protein LOC130974544 [Arachis stenosperma]
MQPPPPPPPPPPELRIRTTPPPPPSSPSSYLSRPSQRVTPEHLALVMTCEKLGCYKLVSEQTQIAANRRGCPRLGGTSEGTFPDAAPILEFVNAMAAAVRESVATTNRAAERLDH